ncbi:gp122 [Sphingomonas phage PAU]|uniref:gp122 n=1 Tax=Sphingomonas phage PAU TaxID=1150991 RepID=UPI000257326D|nr:gp122 [Sphingomonas phage PAU]AFF28120.1 gp122 [Sphingomonas phage PAU]
MSKLLHPKIVKSIESCETYDQLTNCINFTNCIDPELYSILLTMISNKSRELRLRDLDEHVSEMKRINKKLND